MVRGIRGPGWRSEEAPSCSELSGQTNLLFCDVLKTFANEIAIFLIGTFRWFTERDHTWICWTASLGFSERGVVFFLTLL